MPRMTISKRRWIFLPFETKARELFGKTFLACIAAKRGWGVVIGKKDTIRNKQNILPPASFIEKNIDYESYSHIKRARIQGNLVSAWNEEGLIYINPEMYHLSMDYRSFQELDYYFAWGENEARDIASNSNYCGDKIVVSGNPRFDLLRSGIRDIYAEASQVLRNRFGKIILINTNFSAINRNLKGYDHLATYRSTGRIKEPDHETLLRRHLNLKQAIFNSFIEMLPILSQQFPGHTIVVRPHPSESHLPWKSISRNLPNVRVIYEKNANEWILASDVLIHNNCTTGIEGFLMRKPVISYRPYRDEQVEFPLTSQVSSQARNLEELITQIHRFISKESDLSLEERRCRELIARRYIANLDGKLASETIMDTLESLDLPEVQGSFPLSWALKDHLRNIRGRIRLCTNSGKYIFQKFPGITTKELEYLIASFNGVTGKFGDIQTVPVDDDVFCVYRM